MAEPRTVARVLELVRAGIHDRLGVQCADDDDLDPLGLGSLDLIVVLSNLEQTYDFTVEEEELIAADLTSISSISQHIATRVVS